MNIFFFVNRFKDSLTTPIRNEILNDLGVMNPSLLGLPPEIQRKIAKMLFKSAKKSTKNSYTQR